MNGMLAVYEPDGRISNVVIHPPEGMEAYYDELGITYIPLGGEIEAQRLVDLYYVAEGEVLSPKPVIQAVVTKTEIQADDTDFAAILGLPDPVTVLVDGQPHLITGGELHISSPMPATYKIEIRQWPYLPWSTEIVAQ